MVYIVPVTWKAVQTTERVLDQAVLSHRRASGASLSRCHRYRYALWRSWDETRPTILFIGLNPSTADADRDDPTSRRCVNFARDWGYGRLILANLFALRATQPRTLREAENPVGARNDRWLRRLAGESDLVVAAWGNDGSLLGRSQRVRNMIPGMHCLAINRSGEPAHPLYQPGSARPRLLEPASEF